MVLDNTLMATLEEIKPDNANFSSITFDEPSMCGCTGDCGQSCRGGCESGCSGSCGRSCSGAYS